ncbi:phosphotransferase [Novosphingobium colocasiae]
MPPVLDRASVVHGDFRTGNFLFDEASRSITAVLDWELGYIGDRHGDLGWVITDLYITREAGVPYHCGLFAGTDDLVEQYEAAGGLPIDRKNWPGTRFFCTWKQLVLSLGCALRAGDGRTHQDVLLTWLSGGGLCPVGIAAPLAGGTRLRGATWHRGGRLRDRPCAILSRFRPRFFRVRGACQFAIDRDGRRVPVIPVDPAPVRTKGQSRGPVPTALYGNVNSQVKITFRNFSYLTEITHSG